jgi:hypothetical protein
MKLCSPGEASSSRPPRAGWLGNGEDHTGGAGALDHLGAVGVEPRIVEMAWESV